MRKLLSTVSLITLLMPAAASAVTAEELTAQIQALLAQVQALQQQTGGSTTIQSQAPVATGGQCPLISRNLKNGMSGDDVTRLQQFLARDPSVYPEAMITGYYGGLTEAAVKRFQCKNQIVCDGTPETTGYGVTGPRTAALLALQCPAGGANVGGFIRVTPTSGSAPLNVSIEATVNTTKSCTGAVYEIIYGDNSPSATITVPSGQCAEMRQVLYHTYTSAGTYTVILRSGVHQTSATVTVGGSSTGGGTSTGTDSLSASPASGSAPLTVVFNGVVNATGACNPGTYTLNYGDGQTVTISVASCSPNTFSASHTYSSSGNYIARLSRAGTEVRQVAISVTGSSGSTGGGAFSVTAGINGNPFAVTAEFTLYSTCARYDLDWGDGTSHVTQAEGSCSQGSVTKQISHTYSSGGTYTLKLQRGAQLSSTDTIGVVIVQ